MKFQLVLKQKEFEFMNKMNEEWKKKEIEREKQWKKTEASILQIEAKIKNKANELQKREQKIILLEEELKYKMTITCYRDTMQLFKFISEFEEDIYMNKPLG